MPVFVNVRVEGLAALQRKLRKEVLLAPPLQGAMAATVTDAVQLVEGAAPRRSGRLAASIKSRIDARPVPTWARVSVTARRPSRSNPRGYRYPGWLEYNPKSPRQGWFRGAVRPVRAALRRHVEEARRQIEQIWATPS
jgi:hypothetical protein